MFKFFRRFVEFEFELQSLLARVESLEARIKDVRAERDEFKQILFKRFGLVDEDVPKANTEEIKPFIPQMRGRRLLKDLELRAREKHWEAKAQEAEKALEKDNASVSTGTDNA